MTASINFPYALDTNYTFDPALVEVTGGVAKLKDISPAGIMSAAMYGLSIDLSYGGGTLTGTGTGTPTFSGGQLDLSGASNQFVDYPAASNANSQQTGCSVNALVPQYSGNPVNQQHLITIAKANNNGVNLIAIYHKTNGDIQLEMKNSAGGFIMQIVLGSWNPTSGVEYVFEFNWDLDTGAERLFINGTQFGATRTDTGTRSSDIGLYRIGGHINGATGQSNFKVNYIAYYSTVQHTANHTVGVESGVYKYSGDNPTIAPITTFKATELESLTTTETILSSDNIKHVFVASGQNRYVTGGAAADSDGTYAQSSTKAEMATDIENIISARKTIQFKTFLHSFEGSTTPELDLATLAYNAADDDATLPTMVEVSGFLHDCNTSVANQDVQMRPYDHGFWNVDIFNQYVWKVVGTTDVNGHFFGECYYQPTDEFWELKWGTKKYRLTLLDQAEMNLKDCPEWQVVDNE